MFVVETFGVFCYYTFVILMVFLLFDLHLTSSRLKNVSFNIATHFVLDKQNELCELMCDL